MTHKKTSYMVGRLEGEEKNLVQKKLKIKLFTKAKLSLFCSLCWYHPFLTEARPYWEAKQRGLSSCHTLQVMSITTTEVSLVISLTDQIIYSRRLWFMKRILFRTMKTEPLVDRVRYCHTWLDWLTLTWLQLTVKWACIIRLDQPPTHQPTNPPGIWIVSRLTKKKSTSTLRRKLKFGMRV